MYDSFYGFSARPFQLTPDPRFWFESATHRTAMSYLGYGLAQGEGFIVITGEVGSGKTTLVGHVLDSVDPSRMTAARLVSTQVADADLLRLVADAFGIAISSPAKSDALTAIETFLHEEARAGRRTLLIVDEAQNLAVSALEELRMLSNFQLGETALLQIFLLAQPEFRATLASPQLEQLRQRVIATHHLEAMLPEEIEPYLIHRLSLVGWQENPVFAPSVYDALWHASGGIPRRVNSVVSRLLLFGAVEELHELTGDDVRNVVADMGLSAAELTEAPPLRAATPAEPAPAEPAPIADTAPDPGPGFSVGNFASAPTVIVPEMPVAETPTAAANDEEVQALRQQLAQIEERCDEQDAAIRRILGLLIQWVEDDERDALTQHSRAA
jgi:general secretion pathway protein A